MAETLNNRAVSFYDLGKEEEALQLWEQALQVAGTSYRIYLQPRFDFVAQGHRYNDDAVGIREMEEVGKSHPEDWLINYLISLVHLEGDDGDAALFSLRDDSGRRGTARRSSFSTETRGRAFTLAPSGVLITSHRLGHSLVLFQS